MASLQITKTVTCADPDEYERLKDHINNAADAADWDTTFDDDGWSATVTKTEEYLV